MPKAPRVVNSGPAPSAKEFDLKLLNLFLMLLNRRLWTNYCKLHQREIKSAIIGVYFSAEIVHWPNR